MEACNLNPPRTQSPVEAFTNGGALVFPQDNFIPDSSIFWLGIYDVPFVRQVVDGDTVVVTGTFVTFSGPIRFTVTQKIGAPPSTIEVAIIEGENNPITAKVESVDAEGNVIISLSYSYTNLDGMTSTNTVYYRFLFIGATTVLDIVEARMCTSISPVMSIPALNSTLLSGDIHLSPDGETICEVDFRTDASIIQQQPPCVRKALSCLIVKDLPSPPGGHYYTFYCLLPQSLLIGDSKCNCCTLYQKVRDMNLSGLDVRFYRMVRYIVFRYVLTGLLKEFCQFNIEFLRRRYYQKFYNALKTSPYKSYTDYFDEIDYWKYFKE